MKNRGLFSAIVVAAAAVALQACTAAPPAKAEPRMDAPTKNELAADLDPVVAEAAKGYERLIKNGELLFCKRELPVGSKLWTTTCLTEAQLREQVEYAKKFHDNTLQQGRRCSQGPACQPG
jgi:hypothetical protein